MKKRIIFLLILILCFWFLYRFVSLYINSKKEIFNTARIYKQEGIPVYTETVYKKNAFLEEPIFIKNNKALISFNKIGKFKVGQKIEDGKIIFISKKPDLDTGLFFIKTSNVEDGLRYVQIQYNGFFIPLNAIKNNYIYILNNGITLKKEIKIISQDRNYVVTQKGISDGDIVVLSKIDENQKVKIINKG